MQVKHDIYNLSKSNPINISEKELDVKIDVVLNDNKNPLNINSSVSGIVVDTLNNPIKNAIVKLISNTLEPLASARTDDNGKYFINIVPSSTRYTVLATSVEKIVNQSPSFTLNTGESKIINFTLSNDPHGLLGAVSGTITDGNNKAIKGAVIFIYKVEDSSTNLFAITYSDLQGTFLFSELLEGKYKISVQSLVSTPYEEVIIVESKKIYNFSKSLSFISNLSDGSISGTITDNLGNNISKADVILYKVENNIKTPVAFTQTNTFGLYSFGNVPFGDYLVKSNATQSLDINNLVSPSVKITSTSELGTYNLSECVLENGAMVDNSSKFVTALGGVNDGAVTLSVSLKSYGLYTLALYYLSADFNRSLKVEVNGQDINEIYKVSITPGWDITDSKIIYIDTPLNGGINTIKFHGDGKNLAPNVSMITIILNQITSDAMSTTAFALYGKTRSIDIANDGIYSNGAKYDEKIRKAVGIGGVNNGAVNVTFSVDYTISYYIRLVYLATIPNLVLKMDVKNNSIDTYTLTLPVTAAKDDPTNIGSFTVPIDLTSGKNEIKFYGDGKTNGPNLVSFWLLTPPVTQNLTEGFLENGAKVDSSSKFVQGLGGKDNGSSIVTIDVAASGYYKIYIEYVASTTVPLKINVNTIKSNTIVTMLPATNGLTSKDTKIFLAIVYLNTGYNTLKFYGNGKDLGPNISSFIVSRTNNNINESSNVALLIDIYYANVANLTGSATLDKSKNIITSLGGKNNGTATFNIVIIETGEYVLLISYKNNRSFKIDVNGINTNKIYTIFGRSEGVFKTIINLKSGKNTIKIYGNNSELAPDIYSIELNLNSPLSLRKEDFLFSDGAKVLPSGVITSIGGENKGDIAFTYFSSEYAEYTLNFVLSNINGEFLVKVSNKYFPVKNIPTSKATTIPYSLNIILNDNLNFIEILGNGNNVAPDIYSIDLKPAFSDVSKYTFNLSEATLKNKAKVNLNNGFVKNLGGKDNGLALLTFKLDKADYYNLNIQYLNKYKIDTPLRLKVNNKIIEKTYYIPKNEEEDIFVIENILLNQGNNAIEFFGDNINYISDLGKIRLSKFVTSNTTPSNLYYSINGTLANGAKKSSFSKNFIDDLGGTKDGSLTMKINVEVNDFYSLTITYLVIDNRNLLIEVNGEDTGSIYNLPKTDALKEENSKIFEIPINLKSGDNFIKFHGDKTNLAPSIGKIYINKSPKINTYNFYDATLVNAEILDSPMGFISLSNDVPDGYADVKVNVEKKDEYYLTFKYLSPSENFIEIEVDTTSFSERYKLPPTKSETEIDAKVFSIKIKLNSGDNIITFLKPRIAIDRTLLLQSFTISSNKLIQTYEMKNAFLINEAYYNKENKYIQGIGGLKNGYAIIDIFVEQAASYNLVINYLSLDINRKLKVMVNNIIDKKTYDIPTTGPHIHYKFSKTFTIAVDLQSGFNSIKLYGENYDAEGPMIYEVTFSLNTTNLGKIYYLSDGNAKGTTVDKQSKTVSNIGGKVKGEVTLNLNLANYTIYDLELKYKSANKSSILLLDINNKENIVAYNLPMTLNNNFNTINISIPLNAGDNSLRFYGDENNINVILGSFILIPNIKSLDKEKNIIKFDIALGKLANGAKIDLNGRTSGWVTNLGGEKNGSSTVTVDVETNGEYSLIIDYYTHPKIFDNPISLTLDVNSKETGNIHSLISNYFKKTVDSTQTSNNYSLIRNVGYDMSIRKYEIIVNLNKGKNKLKFSGDGKNECPDLGPAILTLKSKS